MTTRVHGKVQGKHWWMMTASCIALTCGASQVLAQAAPPPLPGLPPLPGSEAPSTDKSATAPGSVAAPAAIAAPSAPTAPVAPAITAPTVTPPTAPVAPAAPVADHSTPSTQDIITGIAPVVAAPAAPPAMPAMPAPAEVGPAALPATNTVPTAAAPAKPTSATLTDDMLQDIPTAPESNLPAGAEMDQKADELLGALSGKKDTKKDDEKNKKSGKKSSEKKDKKSSAKSEKSNAEKSDDADLPSADDVAEDEPEKDKKLGKKSSSKKPKDKASELPEELVPSHSRNVNTQVASIDDGDKYILSAALAGNMDGLRALLNIGKSPNLQDSRGNTPLMLAALADRRSALHLLLERNANPNMQNDHGLTAMHIAVHKGNISIVRRLLSEPSLDLEIKNENGDTALMVALAAQQSSIARLLMTAGANVNTQNNRGYTPLHLSSYLGMFHTVNMLLQGNANPNLTAKDGTRPIDLARSAGQQSIVARLSGITEAASSNTAITTDDQPQMPGSMKNSRAADRAKKPASAPIPASAPMIETLPVITPKAEPKAEAPSSLSGPEVKAIAEAKEKPAAKSSKKDKKSKELPASMRGDHHEPAAEKAPVMSTPAVTPLPIAPAAPAPSKNGKPVAHVIQVQPSPTTVAAMNATPMVPVEVPAAETTPAAAPAMPEIPAPKTKVPEVTAPEIQPPHIVNTVPSAAAPALPSSLPEMDEALAANDASLAGVPTAPEQIAEVKANSMKSAYPRSIASGYTQQGSTAQSSTPAPAISTPKFYGDADIQDAPATGQNLDALLNEWIAADKRFNQLNAQEKTYWNGVRKQLQQAFPEHFHAGTPQDQQLLDQYMQRWEALDGSAITTTPVPAKALPKTPAAPANLQGKSAADWQMLADFIEADRNFSRLTILEKHRWNERRKSLMVKFPDHFHAPDAESQNRLNLLMQKWQEFERSPAEQQALQMERAISAPAKRPVPAVQTTPKTTTKKAVKKKPTAKPAEKTAEKPSEKPLATKTTAAKSVPVAPVETSKTPDVPMEKEFDQILQEAPTPAPAPSPTPAPAPVTPTAAPSPTPAPATPAAPSASAPSPTAPAPASEEFMNSKSVEPDFGNAPAAPSPAPAPAAPAAPSPAIPALPTPPGLPPLPGQKQ